MTAQDNSCALFHATRHCSSVFLKQLIGSLFYSMAASDPTILFKRRRSNRTVAITVGPRAARNQEIESQNEPIPQNCGLISADSLARP
jgi:hypothetical protein